MQPRKKILVTGSLGYIGSALTPYLAESGFDCVGLDAGFFNDFVLYPPHDPETIIKDIKDFSKKDLEGIDVVIHLAGISNAPFESVQLEKVYNLNRIYSLKLAELCKESGIKFIFASSCSVYGKGGDEFLDEESETFPQTSYSLNKLHIESDLTKISDDNFSPIILRFATVFGLSPRMRFDLVINMLVGMALTQKYIILNSNGEAWRPNIYIKDLCKAIKYCIDLDYSGKPLLLNVGDTSGNYRVLEIAKIIQSEIPQCKISFLNQKTGLSEKEDLIRDRQIRDSGRDTRTYRVSFELIKKTLKGFACDWSVSQGVRAMIDDFRKLPLTEKEFTNINFYRLQKFDDLLKKKHITEDLVWNK